MNANPHSLAAENHNEKGGLIHFQGNLKRYNAKRKFKGAIEGVMMANMLKRMLQVRRSSVVEGADEGVKKEVVEAVKVEGEGLSETVTTSNVTETTTTEDPVGETPPVVETPVVEGGGEGGAVGGDITTTNTETPAA